MNFFNTVILTYITYVNMKHVSILLVSYDILVFCSTNTKQKKIAQKVDYELNYFNFIYQL